MKNIRLVTYDFGGGYLRTDVEPVGISITENLDKEGNYQRYGFAFDFCPHLIQFALALKKFLADKQTKRCEGTEK